MTTAGDWERLARLIEDDDAVAAAVREAFEQEEDPWAALLDGLDEAGVLAYLQTDDSGMELTDALAQLPRVFAVQPDLGAVTDTDDLAAATHLADAALALTGLRIVRLLEDDDAWPLIVIPEVRGDEIVERVKALGVSALLGG